MLTRGLLPRLPGLLGAPGRRPEERVVVVTGASSGIGRATALLSAEAGDHVVLVARRADVLEEVAEECRTRGAASATPLVADVSDDEAVEQVVADTLARHGRIDAVLHCAGVVTYGRTEDTSAEDFAQVVGTNLLGSASVARHVVPVLRRQERGDLVLVGSLLGLVAVPEMTPYVVSKWGVRALARQLKIENGDLPDVRISHVTPGSVDTPIYDSALDAAGGVNTAPPPTISPERAARVVLRQIGSRRFEVQTAYLNYGLVAAFRLAPGLYDRMVGPVFDAVSRKRS
ncbi:SDR family NAD(P)-dependent oxidoreductase [Nocardioides dongxiaopingii]|uniref:SDR family NAD(P)-dependent oxidoreductase n=1 Tax=Nocardioides TaxID=1839 RepID=UPI001484D310|nr:MULTISPECIES: SDR family NAD(P)-dependent oxidoreductase [Nocardioides]